MSTLTLSVNANNQFSGSGPADVLLVATTDGITKLERAHDGGWWATGRMLEGHHISALLFEPRQQGLFAALLPGKLLYSPDLGKTWQERSAGISETGLYSLRYHYEGDAITLYAGTEPAALYRSTTYGVTWSPLPALKSAPLHETWRFPEPTHKPHLKTLAIDPRNPNVLYAGVEQGALLKTIDGGASWVDLDKFADLQHFVYKDVHQVILNPDNADQLYLTTGLGLFTSLDAGATWQNLTDSQFRIGYPDQILYSPAAPRRMFLSGAFSTPNFWVEQKSARGTVRISDDGGRSWRAPLQGFPEGRANVEAMSLLAFPGGYEVFAGTSDGEVFVSHNGGEGWSRIVSGLAPVAKPTHAAKIEGTDTVFGKQAAG